MPSQCSNIAHDFLSLLRHGCKSQDLAQAKCIYERIRACGLDTDRVLGNRIVQLFVACGSLTDAHLVFNELIYRNVLSWTSLISGYIEHEQFHQAFNLYHKMYEDHVLPSSYTFVALLKGCIKTRNLNKGRQFHVEAVWNGFENDPFVATALVDMYCKFGLLPQAQEAFDKVMVRDSVIWNAIIGGYTEHGSAHGALSCYEKMQRESICSTHVTFLNVLKACSMLGDVEKGQDIHSQVVMRALESDLFVNSSLIDMYVKFASMKDAEKVFNSLRLRNTVAWNSLLAGYADQGNIEEVLKCFEKMELEGISQDALTFVYGLKVCGNTESLCKGQEMHTKITYKGFENDEVLDSMLLYICKCVAVVEAHEVFGKLQSRDIMS